MAPAASQEREEEQGKEDAGTVMPSAPQWQRDVSSTLDDRRTKMKIDQVKRLLGSWRVRCSEMLQATRRGHITGDLELRCLEFMESELSSIIVYLNKALSSQHVDDETMVPWLKELTRYGRNVVFNALHLAGPQHQNTQLRRAAQCFHRRRRYSYGSRSEVLHFYGLAEHSHMYGHLSTAISHLGLPRQVAEEGGGLHPVILDWLEQSPHPFYDDFPCGSYLLMLCVIMFPYGYKFERERLIQKLLCEAGISNLELDSSSAESKGHHYFSDLVYRGAITNEAANSRLSNAHEAGAWQWNVNHLQHQFLAFKSADIAFAFTSHTLNLLTAASATDHGNRPSATSRIPRRLALHHDDPAIPSLLQNVDLSQTRSLAVSGGVASSSVPLHRFVNLVVLDVQGWENFGDDDLLCICTSKMFFLLYLNIRSTQVSKLPPEIIELCSLEVLDASNTQVTELQLGVFEAIELRTLDIRGTPISKVTLPKQTLELRHSLHTLLLGGEGMAHSTETATRLPHDISCFMGLRTLATVDLSQQPANFINALGNLRCLRVLAIILSFHQSSNRNYCEALLESIKSLRDLESLTIHCRLGCSMEFLGSVFSPSKELEIFDSRVERFKGWNQLAKFKVTVGKFAGVPQWFRKHFCLSFVQITACNLGAHDLEVLRDLPRLECLILILDFIPKQAIAIKNEGFHKLQRFSIECPVPWLTFESGAMPNLEYLQLEFHAFPTGPVRVPMGISNLCSLAKVALWYNVKYANSSRIKMTVEAVRKEVAQCRNATQMVCLFINGIEQDDVQAVDEETESATGAASGTGAGVKDDVQEADEITEA